MLHFLSLPFKLLTWCIFKNTITALIRSRDSSCSFPFNAEMRRGKMWNHLHRNGSWIKNDAGSKIIISSLSCKADMFRANMHTHIQPTMASLSLTIQEGFHASHCRLTALLLLAGSLTCFSLWQQMVQPPPYSCSLSAPSLAPHFCTPALCLCAAVLVSVPVYPAALLSVCRAASLLSASLVYLLKNVC